MEDFEKLKNLTLSQILYEGIRGLHQKYFLRNEKRQRLEWKAEGIYLIDPFVPGISIVLQDIDPKFTVQSNGEYNIYEVTYLEKLIYISSFDTYIQNSSYGPTGNLNILHLFTWEDTLNVYSEDPQHAKDFINELLETLERYIQCLSENDTDALTILWNRSRKQK